MSNLNQCNFIGRLGRDPETRYSQSGDAITNITLAIYESYKNKSGEKIDKTEWVNVTFYKKLAEIASEYLKKGSLIFISGKLETRKYTDKQGIERYMTSIIANEMRMLGGKSAATEQSEKSSESNSFDEDNDIPFN